MHGSETRDVALHCVQVLKEEVQEAADEAKRIAREQRTEDDEEEEDNAMNDSENQQTTPEQDILTLTDFRIFEAPQFTMKILQGVPNRCIDALNLHPKRSQTDLEEDLALLKTIE